MNRHIPLADRGPLRVLFAVTSMPVGGAETLLVHLVRRLNREIVIPEVACLKSRGPLGEMLAAEVPVHSELLSSKWDFRVLGRLRKLIRDRRIDALVTVGAGDKMFWGRIAAWLEGLPVVCSALHSTGWPDSINFMNRRLTRITDAFIAVATDHGRFLVQNERFPEAKVHVIRNGVDVQVFQPNVAVRAEVRRELGIDDDAPVIGIVAALRPEKNHRLFLEAAARIHAQHKRARFLIVGDGPMRADLEQVARSLRLESCVHFLGTRSDIPRLVAALDIFALTSLNEASPVSILESLACEVPVVAPRVGSIPEFVIPDETGFLIASGDVEDLSRRLSELIVDGAARRRMGQAGRLQVVARGSLTAMVQGYEKLLTDIYEAKSGATSVVSPSDEQLMAVGVEGSADY